MQSAATTENALPRGRQASDERLAALLAEAARIQGVSLWQDAWRRLRRNWAAMFSLYFLVALALLAFFTPLLPLQSPIKTNLRERQFQWPNFESVRLESQTMGQLEETSGPITRLMIRARLALFGDYALPSLMGTDNLGRDLMARIFWGARVSLVVALVATLVSLLIGVTYGAISGYLGGWVDNAMMRLVDVLYSVPFIFIVIFIISVLSEDWVKRNYLAPYGINQIFILYILIGAIYWLTMARVVRGQVISLKNEQFIEAARTIGASKMRIVFRHLIPNVLGVVIVYLTLTIPSVMLFEAFLSFLGLGVTPPDVSWGILVNEGVQVITPVRIYWWLVLFPGMVFSLTLFALNFLGDGLRDALDPRLKNK